MAKISRLKLTNYKSFREIDFELRDLNILIGPNGAGKSNLLSFFRLLSSAADERLASNISAAGGFSEVRWKGSDQFQTIDWDLTFDDLEEYDETIYHCGSLTQRGNSFTIRKEEVSRNPFPGYSEGFRFLGVYDGYVRYLKPKSDTEDDNNTSESNGDYTYNDQELLIAQIRDPVRYPILNEIRHLLDDWTVFRGFGENALNNLYIAQPLDVAMPLRLDPQGRNLVSVLQILANETKYATANENLTEYLTIAFPGFSKLDIRVVASGMATLYWRSQDFDPPASFPARAVSDGMLRFLGLATLLLLPDPPALIAIDEPEIGLHPKLIPLLVDLLKDASTRTQVIVTTHSPQLLNAEAVQLDDVVLVECENGETTLERPDASRLHLFLERYTLGNLWLMNQLAR